MTDTPPGDASPPPAKEPPLPPPSAAPTGPLMNDALRQRERERLMTLANVQRMRGQVIAAQATLKQALELGGGQAREDAEVHELLGDVFAADEKWEEAKGHYGTAHALDPARSSAERKFGRATLHVADARREREIAEAMLKGELPPPGFLSNVPGKRVPGLALLLSALIPGLGQFYNGQITKGVVCVGIFVITMGAIRLSPDGDLLLKQLMALFLFMPIPGSQGEASALLWMLVFVSFAVWIYSVIDAPVVAGKINKEAERFVRPRIDPATLLMAETAARPESKSVDQAGGEKPELRSQ